MSLNPYSNGMKIELWLVITKPGLGMSCLYPYSNGMMLQYAKERCDKDSHFLQK